MARKNKIRKKIFKDENGKFRYGGIMWVALIVWASYIMITQQIELKSQSSEIADFKAKIEAAEQENKRLTETLEMAGTDEYVERVARQNLGYTKSNEQVFIDSSKSKK